MTDDPTDEPACPTKFDRYKDYENLTTLEDFRTAIWNEIEDFRKEVRTLHPPRNPAPSPSEPKEFLTENPPEDHESEVASPAVEDIPGESMDGSGINSDVTAKDLQDLAGNIVPPSSIIVERGTEFDDLPPPVRRDPSTLVATTDPIASYRRRSSVLQPGFSPHGHSRASCHIQHQSFPSSGQNDATGEGSYILPARSRATSILGGQSQLLRTLSTFSIHEKLDSTLNKLLAGQKTAADAPPSSIPREFVNTDKEHSEH